MGSPNTRTMLSDLIAAGHGRSKARRLEEFMPAIEECLQAGFQHKTIHGWLATAGLEMDFQYYRNAIARLRKRPPRPIASAAASTRQTPFASVPDGHRPTGLTERGASNSDVERQAKVDLNSAGLGQDVSPTRSNIRSVPSERKPFKYDPTAADNLDLNKF